MSARTRNRATTAGLIVALATGTLLLTACGPDSSGSAAPVVSSAPSAGSAAPTPSATFSAAPATPAAPSTAPTSAAPSSAPASAAPTSAAPAQPSTAPSHPVATPTKPAPAPTPVNGTAHTGLTISDGTQYVVMNGTRVDFGTAVRDLAWSPDGHKAAFVDGAGNLVVANPDGSGRVTVAKHGAGETWSHPTWQVAPASSQGYFPAKDNLIFTVSHGGTTQLDAVVATAVNGVPHLLAIGGLDDPNAQPAPQTGNLWPNGNGNQGSTVFANSGNGEVYVRDESLRVQMSPVGQGSQPALSADSNDIVFVRSVDGHDHLFVSHQDGKPAADLTPHATTDYTEPAFSADGRTIAARTPNGIVTLPSNGSAAPTLVSGYTGLPAYRNS
ncbi:hypothetical protein [Kitasatospora sp. LaBMicrA B282]|uniref:TolB family protein n=1 Tax=Kitasatospora sp. LaBMicrA B282 TaxID=3420949 RepID=UPI003D0E0E89